MFCECDDSTRNTGLPSCVETLKYAIKAFFVPLTDSTGVANKIAAGDNVTTAYIITRLNDPDPSKRWYLLDDIKNVKMGERADPEYFTADDKTKYKVTDGVASAEFTFVASSPEFLGVVKSFECDQMGVFYVDKSYKLVVYKADDTGNAYPIPIQLGSMDSKDALPTPTTPYNITTKFDWDNTALSENVRWWSNTVNWASPTIIGLRDVDILSVAPSVTTTTFSAKLSYQHGAMNSQLPVKGLVTADFGLYNETDSASVTLTSVTERTAEPGTYDFVFPAQTSADILHPTGSKNSFDFTNLLVFQVVIP